MKVLAWAFSIFLMMFAVAAGADTVWSGALIFSGALLICPPVWDFVKSKTNFQYRKSAATVLLLSGVIVGTNAQMNTPESKAAAAKAEAERKAKEAAQAAEDNRLADADAAAAKARAEKRKQEGVSRRAADDAKLASGEHCFSGWDGSLRGLKEGVKNAMRNPDSFDHAETTYRRVGDTLEVRMVYRGQNGFGGMNIEAITAKVEPRSCAIVSVGESKSLI